MIGAEATELIQGYAIAKTLESTEAELIRTGLPASDPVGDDGRGRARRIRPRHPLVVKSASELSFNDHIFFIKRLFDRP